jgi:hypothetical protein
VMLTLTHRNSPLPSVHCDPDYNYEKPPPHMLMPFSAALMPRTSMAAHRAILCPTLSAS